MKPNEFETLQKELKNEEPLSIEDFNLVMDMMAMEEDITSPIEYIEDGLGITKEGNVVFADRETIKYEKALRKQKRQSCFS